VAVVLRIDDVYWGNSRRVIRRTNNTVIKSKKKKKTKKKKKKKTTKIVDKKLYRLSKTNPYEKPGRTEVLRTGRQLLLH
jgi:predicted transglutaminase-like protease